MARDLVTSAVVSAVALGYLLTAWQLPTSVGQTQSLGPRAYPLLVGGALLAGAAGLAARAVVRGHRHPDAEPATGATAPPAGQRAAQTQHAASLQRWMPLAGIVVLTALYLVLVGLLGFVVVTAGYLLLGVLVVQGQRPTQARQLLGPAVFAVVTAVVTYVLFATVLNLSLPAGPVGQLLS